MSKKFERVLKMFSLLPWLCENQSATFGELSKRFDYKPKELLADLVAYTLVGVYPYGPGDMAILLFSPAEEVIDAFEKKKAPKKDWSVSISSENTFNHPPRFTAKEGTMLLIIYSALKKLGFSQDPNLTNAFEKIRQAIDPSVEIPLNVEMQLGNQDILKILETAIEDQTQVEIGYESLRDSSNMNRNVEPWRTYLTDAAWYLEGYCHQAKAVRLFRVNRIFEASSTTHPFTQTIPADISDRAQTSYRPDPEDPKVVLKLDPSGRWLLDHLVSEKTEVMPDNKLEVTISVGNQAFLEKLLLLGGKDVRLESDSYPNDLREKAAKRLLEKYYKNG